MPKRPSRCGSARSTWQCNRAVAPVPLPFSNLTTRLRSDPNSIDLGIRRYKPVELMLSKLQSTSKFSPEESVPCTIVGNGLLMRAFVRRSSMPSAGASAYASSFFHCPLSENWAFFVAAGLFILALVLCEYDNFFAEKLH